MKKVTKKFSDHLATLDAAVTGDADLRDNYKLYNKIYRFFSKEGVTFTGDNSVDYNIIVNYIYDDLYSEY